MEEADRLLDHIIPQCEALYSRLAQYEKFDSTVDLGSLINEAMVKTSHWITYWQLEKGPLFSYLSVCAKRLFVGLAKRESDYKGRYYATGDNLEKFVGSEDHEVQRHDAAAELRKRLLTLTGRWASAQCIGVIKMYIDVLVSGDKIKKKELQRAGSYAYGISPELAKFYFSWTLVAMRDLMYDKLRMSYTDQDMFRLQHTHTFLPDMLTVITWDQMVKLMGLFGGQRIKIPTLESIIEARRELAVYHSLEHVQTPEEFSQVAKKHGYTDRSAQEVFDRLSPVLNNDNDGEYHIFG